MYLAATGLYLLNAWNETTDNEKAQHWRLLDHLIRHTPGPVHVSKAAQAEAKRRGLGKLTDYAWHDRAKLVGDDGRKVFAWDHYYTVYDLRRRMKELVKDSKNATEKQVLAVLRLSCVAWILRTEDQELNRLGYRSRRPDPDMAYKEAGITLL
jgi:hypothetical protein